MPIIATFFGIYVRMYFADHSPPHVHVEYQGHEALIGIPDGELLDGSLPKRALAIVQQWAPIMTPSSSKTGETRRRCCR